MTASGVRPVNGASSWRHTPSHGRSLTLIETLLVCALLGGAFFAAVAAGHTVVCASDRAAYGHGTHSYCSDFRNSQTRTTP